MLISGTSFNILYSFLNAGFTFEPPPCMTVFLFCETTRRLEIIFLGGDLVLRLGEATRRFVLFLFEEVTRLLDGLFILFVLFLGEVRLLFVLLRLGDATRRFVLFLFGDTTRFLELFLFGDLLRGAILII